MPWCPVCRTEYDPGKATVCVDCNVPLVDALPPEPPHEEPVMVFRAESSEAEVAAATLRAEGIPAYTEPSVVDLPDVTSHPSGATPEMDVFVPEEFAERAAAVLQAPPMTEEEVAAAEQADLTAETGEAEGTEAAP